MYCATIIWIFFKHVFQMFFPYSVTEILILGFLLRSSISVQVSKKIFEIINKREGIQIIIGVLEKKKKLSRGEGVFFMEKLECVNLLYHCSFTIPHETLRKPLVFWCFQENIYTLFCLYSAESSLWFPPSLSLDEHFCKIQIYWNYFEEAWCKSWTRTLGPESSRPGTRDPPQSLKVGPQDPLQSLEVGPS